MSMQDGVSAFSPAAAGSQLAVQKKAQESVQFKGTEDEEKQQSNDEVKETAAQGVAGASSKLPHAKKIQDAFGKHDVAGIKTKTGGKAKDAASKIGAKAYAQGENVAFGDSPDLHTAAHEAAHVMQQRAGKAPAGGVGKDGDDLEKEADEIADKVVQGESVEAALDAMGGAGGDGDADDAAPSGDDVQSKSGPVQEAGGGGMASADPGSDAPVQRKAVDGGGSGGGMAANPGGDDVQRKAVQKDAAKAPDKFTIRVGGVPVSINLPAEFSKKTFTKGLDRQLAKGVNLTQVRVKFSDQWKVLSGSVSGNFAAKVGDKKLKTSWKLNVNKGGTVAGHVKDVPIEDGPLSGTLSASWAGKKFKATAKAKITDDVKLGTLKGFSARFLNGTNADVTFTHEKLLKAKSTSAAVMLTQKGIDRVKLSGKGSYKAPTSFSGDGDVEVIKPFEFNWPKLKLFSGRKSRGKFSLGNWSFLNLPINLKFGGGMLKSVINKFKIGKLGFGGFGKFDIKNPFKLPSFGGWTPKLGLGSSLNLDFAKNLLKKIKGLADWKMEFGGKDVLSGLFKGISFDPKKWTFSGFGMGNLIGDFDLGSFGGFDFKGLGLGKKLKLPKISLKNNILTNFLGKIDLGVFKGPKFAFGSVDLSWLKGKGLKFARGSFKFPSMPTFSMKPYSVKLDKDTTADADFSNNKLNKVSGQIGATVLKGDKELAHGRLEKSHILVAKKKFTGDGSLNLLTEIPLAKKGGWAATIEPSKAKSVAFKFASNKLKQVKGTVQVRVDKDSKKLLRAGATGTYNGKSFTGKGSAKLLAPLPFKKGKTEGSIKTSGTNLQAAHIVKNALKKAQGTIAAEANTVTNFGKLGFLGSLKDGKLDLRKAPSITGDVTAKLKNPLTLGKDTWKAKVLAKSAATVSLVANDPRAIAGEPLNLELLKDGKKAATIDAKTKLKLPKANLSLNAKGTLHKGVELHDKPRTLIGEDSPVEALIISGNKLTKAKGDLKLALNDAKDQRLGEGNLKGTWARKRGFTGEGQFDLKQELLLKKKGAYGVSLEPTKGDTVTAKFARSKVKQLKGNLKARVDKDGKPFARAQAAGTYNGKTFSGKGKADLLQNVPFKSDRVDGFVQASKTKITNLEIASNKFKRAEGSLAARFKTKTDHGDLDVLGTVENGKVDGGKEPSLSGTIKATLQKDFTVGKGTWKTKLLRHTAVEVKVDNNKAISISGAPLKLYVFKGDKKAAHVEATSKFNLRTVVLDVSAKGTLYKGVQLLDKPGTVTTKNSPLEKLVIKANELHQAKGALHLGFQNKENKRVGEGLLKGNYVKKRGFTGQGKFDLKSEIQLKKKGKHQISLEPTKGPTIHAHFKKSKLSKFKGAIKARVDRDNKPFARAEAEGSYDGKNFSGKGKANLLDDVKWTKGKTTATLLAKGTRLELLKIQKSRFVQAKGEAAVRFQRDTDTGKLDLTGSVKKAVIDSRKETSISGTVEASLNKPYTIGKGTWQTVVKQGAQAKLKVQNTKLQTFATNKIALEILKDKKKAAEVDVEVKFNLRTLVLDAKGSGRLYEKLELGTGPKVVVDKESKVNELVIKANVPNAIDGQVSLTVYDKEDEKLVENAHLKGKWSRKAGFTGEGGGKTARDISAGKPEGYRAVLEKGSGVDKIKVAKGKFVSAHGGKLGVAVHDKDGKLLSGQATLESLIANKDGYAFTGGGNLKLGRTLKVGKKTGKGVRIVQGTEVGAQVKDNKFTKITGALWVGVDGDDGKEIATGELTDVDVDLTKDKPIVSGKGTFQTKKEIKIGKLVTVHKDLMAMATIDKNELTEAGIANANFTVHKLNSGKGAKGTVAEAKLKFPKTGLPDFSFLGGAIDKFEMLKGKLIGNVSQLSFKDMRFGGLGKGTYKPNNLFTGFASLRFDPKDKLMMPWVTLKGDVSLPLLKKKKFYEKGMNKAKPWKLANFGVTVKGVRGAMFLSAGYEIGTEPVVMDATVENNTEFNPEKMEFPDFTAKAKVTGEAYAKGHLTLDGYLGVGKEKKAFFGMKASAKMLPKLTAKLVPSGKLYAKDGKLGGKLGLDFNIAGTAALKTSLDLMAEFLGMDTTLANFGKETVDFGELFKFGWKGEWGFGKAEGKPELGGDTVLGAEPALVKDTKKAYEDEKQVTDKPPADANKASGASGGGMKAMQEKVDTLKILAAVTKAGIKLVDLGISSLPPGLGTVKAIAWDGKLLDASEACVDLTDEINKAEESGLLKKLIDKGGAIGTTMKILKEYAAIIEELSGPSVKEMFENSRGVGNFTGNAMLVHVKVNNVAQRMNGSKDAYSSLRQSMWHNTPLCRMSDVSSRSTFSYLGGALESVGAVDKGTDALQEMSKKDWARRLKKLKKEWKRLDQDHVDKYLPPSPKYRLGD